MCSMPQNVYLYKTMSHLVTKLHLLIDFCIFKLQPGYVACSDAEWSQFDEGSRLTLKTTSRNYSFFKLIICDITCFNDILDKMKEFRKRQKTIICKLLLVNPACAIRGSRERFFYQWLH